MRIGYIIGIAVLVLGLGLVSQGCSWYSEANTLSNRAPAQERACRASFDTMFKKIQETAQVPAHYKNDFKDLVKSEATAKFGPEGSKAVFQWFQERQLNLAPELYLQVQRVIEAGRNDFQRCQETMADVQRKAADHFMSASGKFWTLLFTFPRELKGTYAPTNDLDGDGIVTLFDYPVVASGRTANAFSTGIDESPVDVFGEKP